MCGPALSVVFGPSGCCACTLRLPSAQAAKYSSARTSSEQADCRCMSEEDTRLDPALYVVATPLGNLRDITLRALDVLRGVAVVAAEDTRLTRRLLSHYQIRTQMMALHEHNESAASGAVAERLAR